MTRESSQKLLALLFAALLVGSLAVAGVAQLSGTAPGNQSQSTSYFRVLHGSPDAPPVDVTIDDETVVENASLGEASEYLTVESGTYNVTIAAADDPTAVVFDDEVTLEARDVTTVAATGEVTVNSTTMFQPVFYADDAFTPGPNETAIRIVHLSPDAPAVDVTTADGDVLLADDVTFRNGSEYLTVPAGNYTAEIRTATGTDDGPIVATADVSLRNGTAHTAWVTGYLNTAVAPVNAPLDVVVTEDASRSLRFPGETETESPTPAATETDAPSPVETETPIETDTPSPVETETPIETDTPSPVETETPTEAEPPIATPTPTEPEAPDDGDGGPATPDDGDGEPATPDDGDGGPATPDDGDGGPATPDDGGDPAPADPV